MPAVPVFLVEDRVVDKDGRLPLWAESGHSVADKSLSFTRHTRQVERLGGFARLWRDTRGD